MGHREGVTNFDHIVADLQRKITEQERALYSDKVLEEAHNPRNLGRMPEPDAHAIVRGCCGDTMEIYLRLNGERITEIAFMTDGCGSAVACGSMLTRLVQGKSLEEAGRVTPEDLLTALDGLPKENIHCTKLAVNTLREAIANWHARGEA